MGSGDSKYLSLQVQPRARRTRSNNQAAKDFSYFLLNAIT